MKKLFLLGVCSFFTVILAFAEAGKQIPEPKGKVILSIGGNIEHSNRKGLAQFDRTMLEALPSHQFYTTTPWTKGKHLYEGVLLGELLAYVGAKGRHVVAYALNNYHSNMDLELIRDYPIIVALKSDGLPMRVRDKGPLWIIYPMSDFPQLNTASHHMAMVWQLSRLEIY